MYEYRALDVRCTSLRLSRISPNRIYLFIQFVSINDGWYDVTVVHCCYFYYYYQIFYRFLLSCSCACVCSPLIKQLFGLQFEFRCDSHHVILVMSLRAKPYIRTVCDVSLSCTMYTVHCLQKEKNCHSFLMFV